ncbi:inactive lrr receptor-like serine/threonine-protein kinase bir2 [Quercus suber]|uniref:Inactive lrr receptor-like serine/threonine-protein kinase bir2 n=1 Tax=Quercus suber TaxID=58331 RepID=A0AAW0IPV7_QUESU
MAHNTSLVIALLHIFALSFLNILVISNGFESGEISCLRSIKESLEDPYNKFKHSWNFSNTKRGFICNFVGVTCWNPDENRIIGIELGNMRLKGQFPRTKNCWLLTHLNLSGNELTGTIPSEISDWLPFVTVLDLSSNNFSGEIPKRIWNCTYLNVLRLDNNQLTGLIPPELFLLYRIKNFSVANNRLSGPVPMFYNLTFPAESYANNPGLCGGTIGSMHGCSCEFSCSLQTRIFGRLGFLYGVGGGGIL